MENKQEIIEGSKTLAKFMGATNGILSGDLKIQGWQIPALRSESFGDGDTYLGTTDEFDIYDAKFHTSWDWIMRVRDKWYELERSFDDYETKVQYQKYSHKIAYACAWENVGLVFSVMCAAIKWHNEQKS